MSKNLVIVESPAKAKTLQQFLGKEYEVMSSYGHIRDLKKKDFSVNLDDFTPQYEIPEDKTALVENLKKASEKAESVWLASDEDREGEAIAWHLAYVLGLDVEKTKRIVFHEITKNAILEAVKSPRHINLNLVNAQQARRVLDRIVGFTLSPVLWKKLKPSLSAGRVQSVAVRLIVEREREIQNFQPESSFKVSAEFVDNAGKGDVLLKAECEKRFATEEEALDFLQLCNGKTFKISDISKKPMKKNPAPPFTTSTLQQEAARKLGFSVAQTMSVAQHLYESGLITYMRTDSVNLSSLCINASKAVIVEKLGQKYSKVRNYTTKAKGAQEAHEAIRPTYMNNREIKGNNNEKRLYDLIWKRAIASQMADAEIEKTTVRIQMMDCPKTADAQSCDFIANGEVVLFDGFLRVYSESFDDDVESSQMNALDASLKAGQIMGYKEINAIQHFTQGPLRYTEASLVKKMEDLGIGRPSTYAPTISTIQQREYVEKGNKKGTSRSYTIVTLSSDGKIKKSQKKEIVGNEKGKLLPTDIGTVVNDFLVEYFPEVVDYNFTANVEKEFDEIAEGKENWQSMMKQFYHELKPEIDKVMHIQLEHKVGERTLGKDPKTGKEVSVKIGRFGPIVQIGSAGDSDKPRFAQLNKGQSIQTITLEQALELFKLPRELGELEGDIITAGTGRYGPFILYRKKYISIPGDKDALTISYDEAVELIRAKQQQEASNHIKKFEEDENLEIKDGRYGPYIAYNGKNYKLPKSVKKPASLTFQQCLDIVEKEAAKPKKTRK